MLDRSQFQALTELRKLLVTCSNLRKLGLTCSPGDGPLTLCVPGWQLPPLKYLKLRRMMVAATTALGWQDFMHWESLEAIQCTDIDFFQTISASLQRLRSLEVHLGEGSPPQIDQVHALFDFVKTSKTLENFGMAGMMEEIRGHQFLQGEYGLLKSIRIYEKVSRYDFSESSVLSSDEIKMLGKACSGLRKCSIGIEMWSEWVSRLWITPLVSLLNYFSRWIC